MKNVKFVAFGDSLPDNSKICRSSGTGEIWSEIFPKLINANIVENYAMCGANTNHLYQQVENYKTQLIINENNWNL